MSTNGKNLVPSGFQQEKVCFVIMPFSAPDGYDSDHFDKIYEQIFVPAIESAGYRAHRADKDLSSSSILAKIVDSLINAPMVLCDLSARNPNVFYELGIRHAFDKPVVLVREAGSPPVFDVQDISTCSYRKDRKYDEVLEDRELIKSAIEATEKHRNNSSVIQLARVQKATITAIESMPPDQSRIMYSLLSEMQRISSRFGDFTLKIRQLENRVNHYNLDNSLTDNLRKNKILQSNNMTPNSLDLDDILSEIEKQSNYPDDVDKITTALKIDYEKFLADNKAANPKG